MHTKYQSSIYSFIYNICNCLPTTYSITRGTICCNDAAAVAKFSKNSISVGLSPSTISVTTFRAINGVFERDAVHAIAAASMSLTDASKIKIEKNRKNKKKKWKMKNN